MNLETYDRAGRHTYEQLASTIGAILKAAIVAEPSIRLQQVQHRAKDTASLSAKLEKVGQQDAEVETAVKDLAGCRLIFYANSDVARFLNSGIITGNFEVDWTRTRIHQPAGEEGGSQFVANNYVLRLKDDRASLAEYAPLAGLWCEVQVQTILNHAWSELAHDTVYKQPALSGIGSAQMRRIDERMTRIMREYLTPAGYEFQKVLDDFERLASGKRLIDTEILDSIAAAGDNNERYDRLQKFEEECLPLYDDHAAVYPAIRAVLLPAAKAARATDVAPIKTEIGEMRGWSIDDVIDRILSILHTLRYLDVEATFDAYVDLYIGARGGEKKRIREKVHSLARYDLGVWKTAGPAIQARLTDHIEKMTMERRSAARPVLTEVFHQCLVPEVTGTSSTSSSVTWSTGALPLSEAVTALRRHAIVRLQEQFAAASDNPSRRDILHAMMEAERLPNQGSYGDELIVRVLEDTRSVVEFLADNIPSLSNEIRQEVEHDILFLYRRIRDMPPEPLSGAGVAPAREILTNSVFRFRDALNAIDDFVKFKTLVGYETVYPFDWDEDEFDYERQVTFRATQVDALVATVNDATAPEWFARLLRYAAVESEDLATFPSLGSFLHKVASRVPDIGADWLRRAGGTTLAGFRPGLLLGLNESRPEDALAYVREAIANGDGLSDVTHFLRHAVPTNGVLAEDALAKASEVGNAAAIMKLMEMSVARAEDIGIESARRLFLGTLDFLDTWHFDRWVQWPWLWGRKHGLIAGLSTDDLKVVLGALVNVRKIDHEAEGILIMIAERLPEEVIRVFGRRLDRESENDQSKTDTEYDAVPYRLDRLQATLTPHAGAVVDQAFEWSKGDRLLSEFQSARFVAALFSGWPAQLGAKLMEFAKSGDAGKQGFALSIIRNCEGQPLAFPIMREIVGHLPPGSEMERDVRIALHATGVMHGEFGQRDAYRQIQERIRPWLEDPRENVVAFTRAVITSLDNDIAAAQRSAEEDIAMRRLEYGEPIDAQADKTPDTAPG